MHLYRHFISAVALTAQAIIANVHKNYLLWNAMKLVII